MGLGFSQGLEPRGLRLRGLGFRVQRGFLGFRLQGLLFKEFFKGFPAFKGSFLRISLRAPYKVSPQKGAPLRNKGFVRVWGLVRA